MRRPTLVHLGIHKTGSTWFQDQFIPANPVLGEPLERIELFEQLAVPSLDYTPERFWEEYGDRFDQVWDDGRVAVVSHEIFSGMPARGGLGGQEAAFRLAETFPDAKVWVMVREQGRLIRSMYSEAVKQGGRHRFTEALIEPGGSLSSSMLGRYLDHAARHRFMERQFGERMHFDIHERLVEDPMALMARVFEGFDIELQMPPAATRSNPSLSTGSLRFLRWANHYLKSPSWREPGVMALPGRSRLIHRLETLDRLLRRKPARLGGDWLEPWVERMFTVSNRQLAQATGIDLTAYGYKT